MFQARKIDSLDQPELQPYRTMRRQVEHEKQGIFVAEGEKVVRRLLGSHFTVVSVLLPEKWFRQLEPRLQARPENIDVFIAEKELLEKLTGFSMYQGLLAVGKIPPRKSLDQILSRSPRPWLLAAVDGLSSAENLGSLVRNCAAFNAQALLVGETSSSPFLRRAVRSSMGTIFELPVVATTSLRLTLAELRRRGIRCVAAHPHGTSPSLPQIDLTVDSCLIFGSEGYGISALVLEMCDAAVAVQMPPNIDSLNVASAAAVFLYEANRQRGRV